MSTALVEKWGRVSFEAMGLEKGQKTTEPGVKEIINPGVMTEVFRGWPEADAMLVAEIREKGIAMGCPEQKLQPGFQERLLEFTGTDETVDRMGDIIRVDGWQFENFRANPVFMPWHDYRAAPVGQALDVYVDTVKAKAASSKRKRVRFVILFATEEENPLAETMFRLYQGGFMRATSVGFRPMQVKRPDDEEREKLGMGNMGVIYEKQELLELSGVSVPANPAALLEAGYELAEDEKKEYELLVDKTAEVEPEFALQLRSAVSPDKKIIDLGDSTKSALERAKDMLKGKNLEEKLIAEELTRGVVPANVSTQRASEDTPWSAPSLSDFTDTTWGELSSAQKRRIAGHFAWADASPASAFGQLKLPHHRASDGAIVFRGIAAAAGRFNQTNLPAADRPGVRRHLAAHFRAFGRDVPPNLQSEFGFPEEKQVTWAELMEVAFAQMKIADAGDVTWLWDDEALESALAEDEKAAEIEESEDRGVVPRDPPNSDNAPINAPVVNLTPASLGIDDFSEASASERRRAATFFAWTERNPPGDFEELKFPHHRASDAYRVFRSVSANMRDLLARTGDGEEIPTADRRGVWRHLANHFRQFDRTPPPFRAVEEAVLKGANQISLGTWEAKSDNGHFRYVEETGELSIENFEKNDGTWDLLEASEEEIAEIDALELDDSLDIDPIATLDFRGWAAGAVSMVRSVVEGLLSVRDMAEGDPKMMKHAEAGLALVLRELSAVRQKVLESLPEGSEETSDEIAGVRAELEALEKNQVTIQALKFPKKVWKHESAVRVFAEAAGFVADDLELKEGFFVLPQRKSSVFDGMRDFCLSPGGSEPGDGCRIVATGGTLKSASDLRFEELNALVKGALDRMEANIKSLSQRVNRGAGPNGGAGGDDAQLYSGLLDVTRELADKAAPSKET